MSKHTDTFCFGIAAVICSKEVLKEIVQFVLHETTRWKRARDGWSISGDETLTIHVSIPKPLLDNPPLLHNFPAKCCWLCGKLQQQMISPGYLVFLWATPACGVPHRLGFARCRQVNCEPRRSNSGPARTSPPLSRVPGPQPLPARRGPSRISQMYQHKVSKPQRPTPRCSNPRTRQSPKRALERFLEPPFSGRGWALGLGLFLLNKQTFLGKAHFLESSYLCQQPSPAKWVT